MKALGKTLSSARLSFGKPELLLKTLGVTPGSVTPFALVNDSEIQVQAVLDAKMMEMDLLNYHPLTNHMTTGICPSDFRKFIADCGHTPVTITL